MKKQSSFTIIALVCFLSLSAVTAYAGPSVDKANAKIEKTIDKAIAKADSSPEAIAKLIAKTDRTAAKVIDGVTVVAEYVPVVINGETFMVDPCRVINH